MSESGREEGREEASQLNTNGHRGGVYGLGECGNRMNRKKKISL